MKSEEISVTEEDVPKMDEIEDSSDKVERIKKSSTAYRMESSIEGVRSGPTKIIPSKENFKSLVRLTVDPSGLSKVVAAEDLKSGDLLEECFYYVMESRRDDLISLLKDKVAAYIMWSLPKDSSVYKSDEVGNHVILPTGNALAYSPSVNPNAYVEFDKKMRTMRFYTLRSVARGEVITIGYSSDGVGPSGITSKEYYKLTGENIKSKIAPSKPSGGCSSCNKKKFRSRIEESDDNIQKTEI
jgi:hypothetical protein